MVDFLLGVPGKLKTLLDRITATRAGYLDASISSRATASALTTVDSEVGTILADTAYMQPRINDYLSNCTTYQGVKSYQDVELLGVSVSTGGSGYYYRYYNVTISSVNIAKCVVNFSVSGGTSGPNALYVSGATSAYQAIFKFTGTTTIQVGLPIEVTATNFTGMISITEFY